MKSDRSIPDACDIAIIGGGIVGVCTAYALARSGASVALFEKGELGGEQSSRNWGWVRTLDRNLVELPLALRSISLWQQIQNQIDVGFRQSGVLYVARHYEDMAAYEAWHAKALSLGTDALLLSSRLAMDLTPGSTQTWAGGMYGPTDGIAEPSIATARVAQLAQAHGALIMQKCAARGLEQSAGAVSGVVTEHGLVKADRVLLAGGMWSRLFCANMGIKLPQIRVAGSVLRTSTMDAGLRVALNTRDFTCRKRADGGYTVSRFRASVHDIVPDSLRQLTHFLPAWWRNEVPIKLRLGRQFLRETQVPQRFSADRPTPFEHYRLFEPTVETRQMRTTFQRLVTTFPQFRNAKVMQTWAGYMDVTPDALPVISPVEKLPGFYIATGFSGHGFGLAPAAGELIANMLQGRRQANSDFDPFNLTRFARP